MLCIIFEKDRATGKDAVTADDVLEEVSRNESIDTQNLSVEESDTLSNASINDEGNSNKGKKRKNSSESSDAFREAAMIISTKIEEATDKFSRALGVDLDIALKRDKINEELCKLSNLWRVERYGAMLAMARDHEVTACFFTLEDDEKE
ncbi:hypothetical protein LOK49_LG13G01157 [Camellia lanceoleosa]|uniref:Uncharacterized protein n=1 Tax=Camellia lanceoleosa TaxID=1840588 RepID=A0ACC0FML0_9ERIC|nr:hypothetical protein LOK49_LG13G01157 [Camellia lanceoleosa]